MRNEHKKLTLKTDLQGYQCEDYPCQKGCQCEGHYPNEEERELTSSNQKFQFSLQN